MQFNNTRAWGEGWELVFVKEGVRKVESTGGFRDDMEALVYVVWKAAAGSQYHAEALKIHFGESGSEGGAR